MCCCGRGIGIGCGGGGAGACAGAAACSTTDARTDVSTRPRRSNAWKMAYESCGALRSSSVAFAGSVETRFFI